MLNLMMFLFQDHSFIPQCVCFRFVLSWECSTYISNDFNLFSPKWRLIIFFPFLGIFHFGILYISNDFNLFEAEFNEFTSYNFAISDYQSLIRFLILLKDIDDNACWWKTFTNIHSQDVVGKNVAEIWFSLIQLHYHVFSPISRKLYCIIYTLHYH